MNLKSVLVIALFVCVCKAKNNTKDVIGFPESEEDKDIRNKDNRKPVYLPAMCPINELYYPGDQKDDWICDCRPAFLYHPGSDMCWPAFQKGPCDNEQYLVLSSQQDTAIPVCESNPCKANGYVPWNGSCKKLGSSEPCNFMYPIPAVLGVNATSLVVSCIRLNLENRFGEMKVEQLPCPPGCKRSVTGKCVPTPT